MIKKTNYKNEEAVKRGKRIYSLRTNKGISRRGLAKNIDISDTALANIENGITESITIELGRKICNNLNISFNELFEIESPSNKEIAELKAEIEKLQNLNKEKDENLNLYKERNILLEEKNKMLHSAFIQERSISELMMVATLEKMKQLAEKGEKLELSAFEIRKDAIAIYQKDNPHIELNPFLFATPSDFNKKPEKE
jgi:transcriptional regulator with XRE-family HTH domain